jgi:hypothetical protein
MDVHRAIGDWMLATQADGTFLVVLGLPLTVISAVLMLRADRGPGGPVVLDEMRRFKYAAWGLLPAAGGPDVVGQLEAYWRRLAATTGLAGGLAILLAGLAVSTAVRFGAAGALQAAHAAPWVWQPLMYLALMVGTGVGYPIAMRLSRRRGPDGPRYADLRKRSLADYRTPALRWTGLAIVALPCVAAAFAALDRGWWPLLVIPAEMVLAFAVAEALMSMTATAPRTVMIGDPTIARRCDDLLRAHVITWLQYYGFFGIALACFAQWLLIVGPTHVGSPASIATLLGVPLALLLALFAFANDCRLGGRINGWPGKPMPE